MPTVKGAQPGLVRRVIDAIAGRPPKTDGWTNWVTGAGTLSRDKTRYTFMEPVCLLEWGEIESLYYGDWVSANIIDARPKEYFRRGFKLSDPDDALDKEMTRLALTTKLRQAVTWARLYGGAGIICNVDDGQTVDKPVNIAASRGIRWMNIVDRRYLTPIDYYNDPSDENFGQPRTFQVTPSLGQASTNSIIHESRIIRFLGTEVDLITQRRLAGWSYSALQRPYDVIRRVAQTFQAAGQLMYDASQGVLKVSNLFEQLTGPNAAKVLDRIMQADMARWSGRLIAVDKDGEDFERKPTSFAGIPDMMDRLFLELGGASRTPLTKIFGRSPAGQNATGESDQTMWYEEVGNEQVNDVEPGLRRALALMTGGTFDGEVEWLGLERPNDLAEAEVEKTRAERWNIYVDMGAVSGEQVALVEFLNQPIEDVLDEDALETIVEAEYEMAKEPPQLAPPMVTGKILPAGSVASNAPPQLPPSPPKADGPTFAQRNAAFLADLQDYRRENMVVDQTVVEGLAKKHDVPAPKLNTPKKAKR